MMIPGAGLYVIVRNVRFRWLADTQIPGNFPMAEFGAEDASVSVCFRPIADVRSNFARTWSLEFHHEFFVRSVAYILSRVRGRDGKSFHTLYS